MLVKGGPGGIITSREQDKAVRGWNKIARVCAGNIVRFCEWNTNKSLPQGPMINNEIKHIGWNDYQTYLNQNILTSFHFELIDNESLRKNLNNLRSKSSSGHDGISTCLLKYLSPALINPLRVIINQLLITGTYSNKLKVAKVIPMFKKRRQNKDR